MRSRYSATLSEVHAIIGGTLYGDDCMLEGLTTDSRESSPHDLYVPVRGEQFDGHDFISQLTAENRLSACISEKRYEALSVPYVHCADTRSALGKLAAAYRSSLAIPFVGITGTNGKTTTKELVACALSPYYTVHRNRKNYNNDIGVPFTLFDCTAEHSAAVIEMGMNHAGEISYLTSLVRPDIAVITNADAGHLEFLGSVEDVAQAKSEIFESMSPGAPVFINRDTQTFDILAHNARSRSLRPISYGLHDDADIRPDEYTVTKDAVELVYKGHLCRAALYGVHNVANLLIAVALAEHMGVDPADTAEALGSFQNESMRSQIVEGKCTLINDAYNANPLSMKGALESLAAVFPGKRRIAVLADMKELGGDAPMYHEMLGRQCAEYKVDLLLLYGGYADEIARGAYDGGMEHSSVIVYKEKGELIQHLNTILQKDDVVLIKGSRSMKMEEVADGLVC